MFSIDNKPQVGIGVIIENSYKEVLIVKRNGQHAPYYSIPGGKLDLGETFESAAVREIREEIGVIIKNPKVIAITNNLVTFEQENIHFISIILHTKSYSGKVAIMEPEKFSEWLWCNPHNLPQPHFEASKLAISCFLSKKFY